MIAALMGTGLSAAAGLNAYIPFLLVGLVARFTDVLTMPDSYRWIESPWALSLAAVLLLAEIVLDKIPVIDTINDAIGTVIRPAVGGLIFAATQAAEQVDNSPWMREHPWIGIVGGVVVAGAVHVTKAVSRPAINLTTGGVGGPIVSAVEDASSAVLSLIALFIPVLVIAALIVLGWGLIAMWGRVLRARRRVRDRLDGRAQVA
jgi:hypothetical protein